MLTIAGSLLATAAAAQDTVPAPQPAAPAPAPGAANIPGQPADPHAAVTPEERVKIAIEKGEKLKNPYTENPKAIAEGTGPYRSSCGPCHGGNAGGAMGPPLTNEVWVYGSDDDVLFKLITLGSVELQKLGYKRVRTETVVGPMPPYGKIVKSDDELWKILAYVRSNYKGNPAKRNW